MDFEKGMPIYIQIAKAIKEKIALGQLEPGEKFPSIREIANIYKVNPNTVQRSTQLLESENIIFSKRGIGSFVVEDQKLIGKIKSELADEYAGIFLENMKKIGFNKEAAIKFLREDKND
ncbi:MAG: GntR family transcriptional regulator [Tissierellia bacterium]|nr:GntR family transcriptional regulator [Tissierellia bacterium]